MSSSTKTFTPEESKIEQIYSEEFGSDGSNVSIEEEREEERDTGTETTITDKSDELKELQAKELLEI